SKGPPLEPRNESGIATSSFELPSLHIGWAASVASPSPEPPRSLRCGNFLPFHRPGNMRRLALLHLAHESRRLGIFILRVDPLILLLQRSGDRRQRSRRQLHSSRPARC